MMVIVHEDGGHRDEIVLHDELLGIDEIQLLVRRGRRRLEELRRCRSLLVQVLLLLLLCDLNVVEYGEQGSQRCRVLVLGRCRHYASRLLATW